MLTIISNIKKTIFLFAAGGLATTVSAQQGTGGRERSQYNNGQQQQRQRQEYREDYREERKIQQRPLT